jgi:predicted permease
VTEPQLPAVARIALRLSAPGAWRDSIAGDLLEERARRRASGQPSGSVWCVVHALRIAGRLRFAHAAASPAWFEVVQPWSTLGQDVPLGLRRLRRRPGLPALVVLTLALGIGANVAMFDLVDRLMFRPPDHIRDPERVVLVDIPHFVRYQEISSRATTLDLAVSTRQSLSLGLGAEAAPIDAECVTATYFPVLGVDPVLGRTFAAEDEHAGAPLVAVLSHGLWQRQFAGDPSAIGESLQIAGRAYTVVGVMPRGLRSLRLEPVDAWIPLVTSAEVCSFTGTNLLASAGGSWLRDAPGRIRDGHTLEQVRAELATLAPADGSAFGRSTTDIAPLMVSGGDWETTDGRLARWLAGGAAVLLLLACANVVGLFSLSAIERRREVALRVQLGATRGRVFRQLLVENAILIAACGTVAAFVARWLSVWLDQFFPIGAADSGLGSRGWSLLAGTTVCVGAAAAVLPALQAARVTPTADWCAGTGITQERSRLRSVLLVAQIALALVLSVAAGLFVRSVDQVKSNLGYELDRVLVVSLDLQRAGIRREAEMRDVFDRALDAVRRVPDVEAASLTTAVPLGFGRSYMVVPAGPDQANPVMSWVSPDYFAALGTRFEEGRAFTAEEAAGSSPVTVLDRTLAAILGVAEDAVGQCVVLWPGRPCLHVVGIAEPRRFMRLQQGREEGEAFFPLQQGTGRETIPQGLLVRVRTTPATAIPRVRTAVQSASDRLPAADVRPLESMADARARSWRVGASAFTLFGTLALLLAAIGIYGTVGFAVRQRRPEIGVRLALGATSADILALFLRRTVLLVAVGWTTGLVAAVVGSKAIEALLYGVTPMDPATYVVTSALLVAAALVGAIVPATRATRVDPAVTVRQRTD